MYVVMKPRFCKISPATLMVMAFSLAFPAPVYAQKKVSLGNFGAVSYTHLTLPTICSV